MTFAESRPLVVLYADIAGSTQLYEQHGDTLARDAVAMCLEVLSEVTSRFSGRLVKTIGDEVMCTFSEPTKAIMASNEMQLAVQRASEEDRFATGDLRIKIGFHYGLGIEETTDVFGEAPIVAAQLAKMAKADQILTSGSTLEDVMAALRVGSRLVDKIPVEGLAEEIDVYEMIWEVSGLTQMADIRPARARMTHSRLGVSFAGQDYEVNEGRPLLKLGRVAGNDVVVTTDLTSRNHAEIEYQRGRFYIEDSSSNGTMIIPQDGSPQTLRRGERAPLEGSGCICLGGAPDENPTGVLEFVCE